MDEYTMIGVIMVVLVPILLSFIQVYRDGQKTTVEASSKMTEAITRLTAKIERLFEDNHRQDMEIKNLREDVDHLKETSAAHCAELDHLKHYHGEK